MNGDLKMIRKEAVVACYGIFLQVLKKSAKNFSPKKAGLRDVPSKMQK